MKVGVELRDARRRMNLTLEDISRSTKISLERLSAIESGDLNQLPAPVYLKGFLRAYAAAVNLDGQDVTHRYLEELEQTAQFGGASEAPAVDEGGPVLELPITERSLEEFVSEDELHVQPAPSASPHDFANLNESDDIVDPVAHTAFVTSAPPRRPYPTMLILLVAAAAVAGFLLSANFGWLTRQPNDASEPRQAAEHDAANTSSNLAHASVPKPDTPGADDIPAAAERAAQTESVAEPAALATRKPDVSANSVGSESPANLSGWWAFSNRVESTSYAAFDNLNLGYRVQLEQRGDRITGTGHKWMENGKPLPANRRTPIVFEGTRTGERLELTFTEKGARRVSQGTFVMELTAEGVLQGRFVSDAANSQGTSLARRTPPPAR